MGEKEHKTPEWWCWVVLFFICWLTFGSYWVYDAPGALYTQFREYIGDTYTSTRNLTLYSVYSYPNIILCFFGGFIIDKLTGVRAGAVLFISLIFIGEIMFVLGVVNRLYPLMVTGRFVFGLGGESLTVAQNTYTARWFDGKRLAFAFGLVVCFSRIGSSINFAVTPILATVSVPFAVWIGAGTTAVSFGCAFVLAGLDYYGRDRVKEVSADEEVKMSYVRFFPLSSWLVFFICLLFYVSVLTFYTVASVIMQHTGSKFPPDRATLFISIPNLVAIVACPAFGFMIDKLGRSLNWIMLACAMSVVAHLAFLANAEEWTNIHPIPIMIWIGIAYALCASSIWPCLPFIIKDNMLGTAYGTMTAIQNFGLAVFPQMIGAIQDASGINGTKLEYSIPIIIFIVCAGAALTLTLVLIGVDKRQSCGVLNETGVFKQRWKEMDWSERAAMVRRQNGEEDFPGTPENERAPLVPPGTAQSLNSGIDG